MRRLAGRRKRPPLHGPSAAPHRLPPRVIWLPDPA